MIINWIDSDKLFALLNTTKPKYYGVRTHRELMPEDWDGLESLFG